MNLFLFEISFGFFSANDFFFKRISAVFGFNGFENFYEIFAFSFFLQGCNYLFCHGVLLFDFFVECYFLKEWIVFLQFDPFSCVLFVFGGNVPTHAWNISILLFCTFQNDLYAIAFFCHDVLGLNGSFLKNSIQSLGNTDFIDCSDSRSGNFQSDPLACFRDIESLFLQICVESTLCFAV